MDDLGNRIGPRRHELFKEICTAWFGTEADDRQVIRGLSGDDMVRLLHPGFSGRNVSATLDDLRALESEQLIILRMTGKHADCELEPHPKVIETLRDAAKPTNPERPTGFETESGP